MHEQRAGHDRAAWANFCLPRCAGARPVDGVVQKRDFKEGSDVKEGSVSIRSTRRVVRREHACFMARPRLTWRSTSALVERTRPCLRDAISKQDYDNAVATRSGRCDVATGRPPSRNPAQSGYTTPSRVVGRSGLRWSRKARTSRPSRPLDGDGAADRPIYVDLTRRASRAGSCDATSAAATSRRRARFSEVTLMLEDGRSIPAPVTLQFSDITVDQGRARDGPAIFPTRIPLLRDVRPRTIE